MSTPERHAEKRETWAEGSLPESAAAVLSMSRLMRFLISGSAAAKSFWSSGYLSWRDASAMSPM